MSPKQVKAIQRQLGPQVVGGVYHCGYWNRNYRVEAINIPPSGLWTITVLWLDEDRVATHMTAWDYKWDRVVA